MNDKIGGVKGHREEPRPPSSKETRKAEHIPSKGGKLGEGMDIFSKFIWIITFSWVKVSFSDWKEKRELCSKLSNEIPRKGGPPETKKAISTQLRLLSLEQLKNLHKHFKNEDAKDDFRNLNLQTAERIFTEFISLLRSKEIVQKQFKRLETVEDLIFEIKKDEIYEIEGHLSLLPSKPELYKHIGYLPPKSLENAKKNLKSKWKIEETFKIHFFADKMGRTREISISTTTNEVQEGKTKFLTVTFSSDLITYSCKFAFHEGESRDDLVERITKDGLLEKELLHLQAKCTKEAIS